MRSRVMSLLAATALLGAVLGEGCGRSGEAAEAGGARARRVVVIVVESFNAGEVGRVRLPTIDALRQQGTWFRNCYTCPPTRKRKDKKFGTVVSNIAIVTGTVFWTREKPFNTLGHAVSRLGNSMNLAAYPSYNCINPGFTHTNTKAGKGAAAFFRTTTALYQRARPVMSIVHPQAPGEVKDRSDITSAGSPHIRKLIATDAEIGRFIAMLKQRNEWNSTVLAITGDHGFVSSRDGPRDPHPPEHIDSWNTPLILVGPGVRAGLTVDYSEQIDIAPTVCHLLGVAPPRDSVGRILGEALTSPPRGAPTSPARKYMLEWFNQNRAFHAQGGRRESAADFYGQERFMDWGRFRALDALLNHNIAVLKKLGIAVRATQ